MTIYINDRPALLKSGSSFEYISENRLFLGRDGYTLTLTFPLKGCPQNREIFGHIERMDVSKNKLLYECSIIDNDVTLFGTLQVTGIDSTSVKAQFSEGRCEQVVNNSLEDIYINQLDLGEWPEKFPDAPVLSASAAEVTFPWINTSYPTDIQNLMTCNDGNLWTWAGGTTQCSWQLKLFHLTKRICEALGYEADLTEWSNSPLRYLIVCNTLPAAWDIPQYARALPDWTAAEFFEKLELFLSCEFDFDHRAKTVRFTFSKTAINNLQEVEIKDVVDTYESEISKADDTSCDYIGSRNLVYKNTGHQLDNYYSCDWLLQKWPEHGIMRYATMDELLAKNPYPTLSVSGLTLKSNNLLGIPTITSTSGRPGVNGSKSGYPAYCLLYAEDVDTYFVYRAIGTRKGSMTTDKGYHLVTYYTDYALQPVNVFGSRLSGEDTEDIEFVPVCIDHTDDEHGYIMFLSPSDYNESEFADVSEEGDSATRQLRPAAIIEAGDHEKTTAYYDSIFVAFGTGGMMRPLPNLPCPTIDYVVMSRKDYFPADDVFSLRRYGQTSVMAMDLPEIDPRQKIKISFLSDTIPNPRSIFNIRGKRYICEKITATFTEKGLSQLLKGEFYPLAEN